MDESLTDYCPDEGDLEQMAQEDALWPWLADGSMADEGYEEQRMNITAPHPQFVPGDKVLFYREDKEVLVLATVEYGQYSPANQEWRYALQGWNTTAGFAENRLTRYSMGGLDLHYTT